MFHSLAAFIIRDFYQDLSYPFSFLWRWSSILFHLVTFFFLGRLLGGAASPYLASYGGDYFAFAMVGLALAGFQEVGLSAVSRSILIGMYTGTLEAMLLTPISLSTIVFNSVIYQFFSALLSLLIYLLFGVLLFGFPLGQADLISGAAMLLLALLAHLPLGVLSASFLLLLKQSEPVTLIISRVSILLGGVYFPLQVLPTWLQQIAWFLPFTHALEGLRLAMLQGKGLPAVLPQVWVLLGFTAALLPFSLAAFAWAVRQAKRLGTLSQF